jgi:uncharacterized protein (DUF2126 family)
MRIWNFAFRRSGRSPRRESNSNCVRRSSPGTCWRRRPFRPHGAHRGLIDGADAGEAVRVRTESRYVVACNGRRVPLQLTGEPGTALAGVRFRARKLSATLHPTVPVHAPLVFHLIDRWKGARSANVPTMWDHPTAAFTTSSSQRTPRRPKTGAWSAFRWRRLRSARWRRLRKRSTRSFPMTLDLRLPPRGQNAQIERPGLVS